MKKEFKLKANEIKRLLPPMGGCMATDKITVEGLQVRYMYREDPFNEMDSGWRLFSGTESQEYVDEPSNTEIYDLNTIANYDRAIIPYLTSPIGTVLERLADSDRFIKVKE
ncbi:DUF2185 domain-containing protein [Nafulsella turpanensis]|uniref:DUF2185 domain-containing protein n=1 Tax=Nafulsella turpanensis TaxID=1265690 RepID=UPI000348385F|nr:DUF2185 domain-containing protein [Nafulsella turpanensis]